MALDLRDTSKYPRTATLTGNNTTIVEIKIPVQAYKITIGSTVDTVKIFAYAGLANGDTVPTSNYQFVTANNILEFRIGRGSTRRDNIFVAFASSATGIINVVVEEI